MIYEKRLEPCDNGMPFFGVHYVHYPLHNPPNKLLHREYPQSNIFANTSAAA
jgi:hypothetical protein